jgi:hypothetical protein
MFITDTFKKQKGMERKFKAFTIYTALREPVTIYNFHKYSISIYNADGELIGVIRKEELCLDWAKDILQGNEEQVKNAIKGIIDNRLYHINRLRLLL